MASSRAWRRVMFKQLVVAAVAWLAASAACAVEVNRATRAELEAVRGLGPGIVGTILDERQKGPYKDWRDFVSRVKGVREATAVKLSAAGLTVGGLAYAGEAAAASAPGR